MVLEAALAGATFVIVLEMRESNKNGLDADVLDLFPNQSNFILAFRFTNLLHDVFKALLEI